MRRHMRRHLGHVPLATAAAALMLATAPGRTHHAVQAQFDVSKIIEKRGVLVKIDWINPHTYMHFEVNEDGAVKRYAIESLGILGLRRVGIDSKSSFKVGEPFVFSINPSRDGSATGLLTTLIFPDGRRFDVKNTDPTTPATP
jgi:hypothetical protein